MLRTRIFVLLFLFSTLSGCDRSKEDIAQMSNIELRKEWRNCAYVQSASTSEQKMCKNYEAECNDRKNEGNFSCY